MYVANFHDIPAYDNIGYEDDDSTFGVKFSQRKKRPANLVYLMKKLFR